MQVITQEDISTLEVLVSTLEDGRQGFATVADSLDEAGRADLAATMRRFSAERAGMSDQLRALAAANGEQIDAEGSASGAVHRSWISVKDALTGNDAHALLAAAEEGEDHALETYEDVIDAGEVSADLRLLLVEQAAKVRAAHDQVRALRDSLA